MPVQPAPLPFHLDRASGRAKAHRALSASKRAETGYVSALLGVMRRVHATVLAEVAPGLPAPESRRDALRTLQETGPISSTFRLDALDDRLVKRLFKVTTGPVQLAFDGMAGHVDKNSARGSALVGIKPGQVPGLASVIDQARRKNVQLIQGATQDFVDDVRDVLEETAGQSGAAIAKALQGRVDVSKSRAVTIARCETLKLNSQITQHRQRAAGVTQYRWSTSKDERVRPGHKELEGTIQSWDDPPETNDDGDTNHPGEDYNCRCVPIPYLADLEGDDESSEEAEEPDYGLAAE